MKKLIYILTATAASSLLFFGCAKEPAGAPQVKKQNPVHFSFSVEEPEFEDETGTRVSLTEGVSGISWTGDETASVIVGKTETSTTTKAKGLQLKLTSKSPGVFEGTLDLGSFTQEDVKGIVIPHECGAYYYYNSGNKAYRFYIPIPASQTQDKNGVLNPQYLPFCVNASYDELSTKKLSMYAAGSLLRFNVYGKHPEQDSGEVLQSVRVDASGVVSGRCEWNYGTTGAFNSNGSKYVTASLSERCTIADKTSADGVKLYAGVVLGGNRTLSKITVTTDQAVYTKDISATLTQKKVTAKPVVYRYGVNLAASGWTRTPRVYFSTDEGANWSNSLPSGQWTSLAVKTSSSGTLSSGTLASIASAIAGQAAPVDLDLSEAKYESATFPATFKGSSDSPYTKLASIRFPSNVTIVDESAFEWCSGLESVDLDGITTINTMAFYRSGLVNLTIPVSVTSMPGYLTFGCCPNLSTVYYDTPAPQVGGNGSSGNNHAHFAWATMTSATNAPSLVTDAANSPLNPLTVTFGLGSTNVVRYMFRYNYKLTTLVFKTSPSLANYAFADASYLETFDFSNVSAAPTNDYPGNAVGSLVASGTTKRILVPEDAVSYYASSSPWSAYVNNGYVLDGVSSAQGTGMINVRFGTFNIRTNKTETDTNNNWANRKERFFTSVSNINFDVFGLQEVTVGQYGDLRNKLGEVYDFYVIQTGSGGIGAAWKKDKYDVLSTGLYWINPKDINAKAAYDKPTTGTYAGSSFYRACTGILLKEKATGIKFLFMATHYCLSAESRKAYAYLYPQFEAAWNPYGYPCVLVGDLNAKPDDPCHVTLKEKWNDTFLSLDESLRGGIVNTYNGWTAVDGKSRIDYIYWKGSDLTPTYYECDNTTYDGGYFPSDHFPVFADFTINCD